MTKDFIDAVKRYVEAQIELHIGAFGADEVARAVEALKRAEALLDSFGAEEKKGIVCNTEEEYP